MDLLPLHYNWHYKKSCIELLNETWPRSESVRSISLEKSCDDLPISLILIDTLKENRLIGHAKLCRIPNKSDACWVESVIVYKAEQGKGYGKTLMSKVEDFARDFGFATIYLSTHDKRGFYEKLGYRLCPFVLNVGANAKLFSDSKFQKFTQQLTTDESDVINFSASIEPRGQMSPTPSSPSKASSPPPAPPPPLPPSLSATKKDSLVYMKKELACV